MKDFGEIVDVEGMDGEMPRDIVYVNKIRSIHCWGGKSEPEELGNVVQEESSGKGAEKEAKAHAGGSGGGSKGALEKLKVRGLKRGRRRRRQVQNH